MKTLTTNAGAWEAQLGYAVFWGNGEARGSGWVVSKNLTVTHDDGPPSPPPPMHIRRTAIKLSILT